MTSTPGSQRIETALPFPILGFDTDNGGEFLNWHLVRDFKNRPKAVDFTRASAHRKNDNAHVEQKNWPHVRQLVGQGRLEGQKSAKLLDDLYGGNGAGAATSSAR